MDFRLAVHVQHVLQLVPVALISWLTRDKDDETHFHSSGIAGRFNIANAFFLSPFVRDKSSLLGTPSLSHSLPLTPNHSIRSTTRFTASNAIALDPNLYVERISRPCGSLSTRHSIGALGWYNLQLESRERRLDEQGKSDGESFHELAG